MATYVAVFALLLAYVALVAAYLALRTLARLRRAASVLARGARGPEGKASIVEATSQATELVETIAEEMADLRGLVADSMALGTQRRDGRKNPSGLRNLALVRYDAFGDMSGRLSFSLALLDDSGDGVTISAISGATDTRVYAKGVTDGKGEHELSPEERQAVSAALDKRRPLLRKRSA